MIDLGDRKVLPWEKLTAEWLTAETQQRGRQCVPVGRRGWPVRQRSTWRQSSSCRTADRLDEVAERFFPDADRKEALKRFADPVEALLQLAAINSQQAYWRHSWSGPAELVGRDGAPVDLEEIAAEAVWPETAYQAWHALASMQVDVRAAKLVEQKVTASGAQVVGGFTGVKVGRRGVRHAGAGPRPAVRRRSPARRATARGGCGRWCSRHRWRSWPSSHQFLPYDEIASVTVTKRVPAQGQPAAARRPRAGAPGGLGQRRAAVEQPGRAGRGLRAHRLRVAVGAAMRTIDWVDGAIEIIDQTALPGVTADAPAVHGGRAGRRDPVAGGARCARRSGSPGRSGWRWPPGSTPAMPAALAAAVHADRDRAPDGGEPGPRRPAGRGPAGRRAGRGARRGAARCATRRSPRRRRWPPAAPT